LGEVGAAMAAATAVEERKADPGIY
jgi:hypothetical protein